MTTDQISRAMGAAPLRESYWPRDTGTPLIEHTVGSLLEERARTHADALRSGHPRVDRLI